QRMRNIGIRIDGIVLSYRSREASAALRSRSLFLHWPASSIVRRPLQRALTPLKRVERSHDARISGMSSIATQMIGICSRNSHIRSAARNSLYGVLRKQEREPWRDFYNGSRSGLRHAMIDTNQTIEQLIRGKARRAPSAPFLLPEI